jgi:hypothetical protein
MASTRCGSLYMWSTAAAAASVVADAYSSCIVVVVSPSLVSINKINSLPSLPPAAPPQSPSALCCWCFFTAASDQVGLEVVLQPSRVDRVSLWADLVPGMVLGCLPFPLRPTSPSPLPPLASASNVFEQPLSKKIQSTPAHLHLVLTRRARLHPGFNKPHSVSSATGFLHILRSHSVPSAATSSLLQPTHGVVLPSRCPRLRRHISLPPVSSSSSPLFTLLYFGRWT